MSNVSLKSLLVPSKTVSTEYPGLPGFVIDISFLSRESLSQLRQKCTKTVFKGNRQSESFDSDLFLKLYSEATILGWKGLKYSYLAQLAPVDLTGLQDDDEIGFSEDNALYLLKASSSFDNYISEFVSDLGNFSKSSSQK